MGHLSKAITEARKSKFESRGLASAALNIHFRTQANYELGDRVPSIGYLVLLSNICNYPLVKLLKCAILDDRFLTDSDRCKAISSLELGGLPENPPAPVNVVLDISNASALGSLRVNGVEYKEG